MTVPLLLLIVQLARQSMYVLLAVVKKFHHLMEVLAKPVMKPCPNVPPALLTKYAPLVVKLDPIQSLLPMMLLAYLPVLVTSATIPTHVLPLQCLIVTPVQILLIVLLA